MQQIPIADVWGEGRQYSIQLQHSFSTQTAWELSMIPAHIIRQKYNVVLESTVRELNGEPCFDLEIPADKKSITHSRSFSRPVTDFRELSEAIANYSANAAEKIRKQSLTTSHMLVFVMTNRFSDDYYSNSAQIQLSCPTSNTMTIVHKAKKLLQSIYLPNLQYKKVGVILSSLHPSSFRQHSLFDENEHSNEIINTMDAIIKKMGRGTVFLASQGLNRSWQMRREMRSPRFTTHWNELPLVY